MAVRDKLPRTAFCGTPVRGRPRHLRLLRSSSSWSTKSEAIPLKVAVPRQCCWLHKPRGRGTNNYDARAASTKVIVGNVIVGAPTPRLRPRERSSHMESAHFLTVVAKHRQAALRRGARGTLASKTVCTLQACRLNS